MIRTKMLSLTETLQEGRSLGVLLYLGDSAEALAALDRPTVHSEDPSGFIWGASRHLTLKLLRNACRLLASPS